MSDVMLLGVLRMPPELWQDTPLDVTQRHSRYVEAADKIERLRAELASMKSELKEISIALNDPADNLIRTTAECVSELRKDAKRYLWLRDSAPEKWAPWADEREDTTPKEIDAAIDAALSGEGK